MQSIIIYCFTLGTTPKKGRDLLDYIVDILGILPKQKDCLHCGAKKFYSEMANFCCANGDIVLMQNKLPDILRELLTSSSEEAETFR